MKNTNKVAIGLYILVIITIITVTLSVVSRLVEKRALTEHKKVGATIEDKKINSDISQPCQDFLKENSNACDKG